MAKQGDEKYHPPSETSSKDENNIVVRIKNPSDRSRTDNNEIEISADARAINNIKKIELYIDGSLKTSVDGDNMDEKVNLADGRHKIKIKAYDEKGNSGEKEITVGVKTSADEPTNTPVPPTNTPVPVIPTSTITPSPTP